MFCRKYDYPYPHLIIDDFLDDNNFDKIKQETDEVDLDFFNVKYIKENSNLITLNDLSNKLNCNEFYQDVYNQFGVNAEVLKNPVGLRNIDDNPIVAESYVIKRQTDDKKWLLNPHFDSDFCLLSGIFYISGGDGYNLTLLSPKSSEIKVTHADNRIIYYNPDSFNIIKEIKFKPNRAIIILNDPKNTYHGIINRLKNDTLEKRVSINFSLEKNQFI